MPLFLPENLESLNFFQRLTERNCHPSLLDRLLVIAKILQGTLTRSSLLHQLAVLSFKMLHPVALTPPASYQPSQRAGDNETKDRVEVHFSKSP